MCWVLHPLEISLKTCSGNSVQKFLLQNSQTFPAIQLAVSKFDMKQDSDPTCVFFALIFMEMGATKKCRAKE